MSDPQSFLTRWSRRKRKVADEAAEKEQQSASQAADGTVAAGETPQPTPASAEMAEPVIDLTKLPSINQITADTDISGFLAPGVPAELKAAALRRAWVADPKIRDFVGLNDYDFDFHTPGAIPGFGPLEMTDELRREVARIVGNLLPEDQPLTEAASGGPVLPASGFQQPAEATAQINAIASQEPDAAGQTPRSLPEMADNDSEEPQLPLAPVQTPQDLGASQQNIAVAENLHAPARRSHGGALPK